MDPARVEAVLADWRAAPVDPRLRATLAFLEKLTLRPDEVGPDDAAAARAAGVSDDALEDAAHVCALFTTYVRLADTLAFHVMPASGFDASARVLLRATGYALPPPVAWLAKRARRALERAD